MMQIRTDLAIEQHEILTEAAEELVGVTLGQEEAEGLSVSRVTIEDDSAAAKMGKPKGHYVTVEFPHLNLSDGADYEALCRRVAKELVALLPKGEEQKILVVGLGNEDITPDSLGPKAISRLMVTRHLFHYMPEAVSRGISSVCAIAPGVLGTTGMETGEIVQGVVEKVRPTVVIAIDALAARSVDRISTTIQLCDTGISPGAGVGNRRKALNVETLGVPVLAVGVPTVIDAITITADALRFAEGTEADEESRRKKLAETVPEALQGFMVTPKDVDLVLSRVSKAVADGINLALHKGITFHDIEAYTG